MLLKEVPCPERPREKVLNDGIERLSNIEIIALLLGTGTRNFNVLDVAKNLVYYLEDISDLSRITLNELIEIEGIGKAKAITILAAVELGKRMQESSRKELNFSNPESIFEYFEPRMRFLTEETLYVIYIDIKGNVISIKQLTKGTQTQTLVDPKLIFKYAYKFGASSMILVHNHPTGDPTPSLADLKITAEISKMAKVINFEILDHVIIGKTVLSMRRQSKTFKVL